MFGLGLTVGLVVGGAIGSFAMALIIGGQLGDYPPPTTKDTSTTDKGE